MISKPRIIMTKWRRKKSRKGQETLYDDPYVLSTYIDKNLTPNNQSKYLIIPIILSFNNNIDSDGSTQRTPLGRTISLIIGWYQEHFVCAVLGTMWSRFCVPDDTKCDIPDIIWNIIIPNIIRHILLISDFDPNISRHFNGN